MKLSPSSIGHGLSHVKSWFVHGYNQAHKFAQGLDKHVNTARRVYGVLSPLLDQIGGGALNTQAMKSLSLYDDARRQVIDADTRVQDVRRNLQRAAPELF